MKIKGWTADVRFYDRCLTVCSVLLATGVLSLLFLFFQPTNNPISLREGNIKIEMPNTK